MHAALHEEPSIGASIMRLTAEADLWSVLALTLQFPTKELSEGLVSGALLSDVREIALELGAGEVADGDCAIGGALADLGSYAGRDAQEVLRDLRRERTRLFDHPENRVISLFEGVFLDAERVAEGKRSTGARLFVNPAALDAERQYRAAGLKAEGDVYVPADSITTQLAFLTELRTRQAKALLDGDATAADEAVGAYEEFERLHVGRWFDSFFTSCATESREALYRAVGLLGQFALRGRL